MWLALWQIEWQQFLFFGNSMGSACIQSLSCIAPAHAFLGTFVPSNMLPKILFSMIEIKNHTFVLSKVIPGVWNAAIDGSH